MCPRISVHEPHYPRFLNKNSYPETERNLPKSERGHTKKERDDNRKERERKRGEFLSSFKVPDFLKNDTCTDLNGYFGCSGEYDEKEKLESYSALSLGASATP